MEYICVYGEIRSILTFLTPISPSDADCKYRHCEKYQHLARTLSLAGGTDVLH